MPASTRATSPSPAKSRPFRRGTIPPSIDDVPMTPGPTIVSEFCDRYPLELRPIFGKRPLLPGEEPHDYDALVRALEEHYRPRDVMGWFLVWQIAGATWDLTRLRRVACLTVSLAEVEALARLIAAIRPRVGRRKTQVTDQDQSLARRLLRTSASEVDGELIRYGADLEHLRADAHLKSLPALEALDRLQISAEKRIAISRRTAIELQFEREQAFLFRERHRIAPPAADTTQDTAGDGASFDYTAGAVTL